MLGVMDLWNLKSLLNFWKMILLWLKRTSNWLNNKTFLKKIKTLISFDFKFKILLSSLICLFLVNIFLCNHNFDFSFQCICNIRIEDWKLVLCCNISIPYLTFVIEYHMMKWATPKNDLMVFNVGSLIRVGNCGVLCCLVETWNLLWILSFICCTCLFFCKCFWGMCIVLGHQFCFVLHVICFHLWLEFP
jgi:hypothetical protein